MSSIRSKIEKFEALSRDEVGEADKHDTSKRNSKRFKFPGNNTILTDTDNQTAGPNFITASRSPKGNGLQDFEADLQEVWSVRKNIHHTGNSQQQQQQQQQIVSSSNSSTALGTQPKGLYSRHWAAPQPSRGPQVQPSRGSQVQPSRGSQVQPAPKDPFSRGPKHKSMVEHMSEHAPESKRVPLQDFNSKESPWNVKKGGYSYNSHATMEGMSKRPMGSPKATEPSLLPAAKRRINFGGMDVVRPTADHRAPQLRGTTETPSEKVGYAKKMAEGYLKSMGMGEFTPKTDKYSKERIPTKSDPTSKVTRWKRLDDDQDFEFDI